jgi:pimeloyl-ACP methyl ester carboxylesterase
MRYAEVNGIKIAFDIRASGPPLVLIMGYRLNSRAWPLDFAGNTDHAARSILTRLGRRIRV